MGSVAQFITTLTGSVRFMFSLTLPLTVKLHFDSEDGIDSQMTFAVGLDCMTAPYVTSPVQHVLKVRSSLVINNIKVIDKST